MATSKRIKLLEHQVIYLNLVYTSLQSFQDDFIDQLKDNYEKTLDLIYNTFYRTARYPTIDNREQIHQLEDRVAICR